MKRRDFLVAAAAAGAAAGKPAGAATGKADSMLSVEGYIFQQYASRKKAPLGEVLEPVFEMARNAGFRNVELNQGFFTPELRGRTLELLHAKGLAMPSVYVGGAMHEADAAAKTTDLALEIAALCKPFGCRGVVNNPSPKPRGVEKTDAELKLQCEWLNRMGESLGAKGYELRIHNHTPEMVSNAREFRATLAGTSAKAVAICLDIDWVYQGGMDPDALLKEAGRRVTEVHVRNSKNKLWLESFGEGDLDYRKIAAEMKALKQHPSIVVELAYRDNTPVTRTLEEDLRLGREYAESVFR
jgi:inosose dehydratase